MVDLSIVTLVYQRVAKLVDTAETSEHRKSDWIVTGS